MSNVKKMILAALCAALGVILPMAFHTVANAGAIFLPMHIPVLLCGLLCGWQWGLLCGAVAPTLSMLLTGMPPMAVYPGMLCELAVYGVVAGLLMKAIRIGKTYPDSILSLMGAMLAGRVVSGVVNALIFRVGQYSLEIWLTASFVTSLPGIAIQIAAIPLLLVTLEKTRAIPRRY